MTYEELLKKRDLFTERVALRSIRSQIKQDRHMEHIRDLSILIVSDRALGRARGLYEYFLKKTNIRKVKLVSNYGQAEKYLCSNHNPVDVLLFVGYQNNRDNYSIIELMDKYETYTLIGMFAFVDVFIQKECNQYNIGHLYHCYEPIRDILTRIYSYYKIEARYYSPPKHHYNTR